MTRKPGPVADQELARLRNLAFCHSKQLLMVLDAAGTIVDVTGGLERRGWNPADIVGRSIVDVAAASEGGRPWADEWEQRLATARLAVGPASYVDRRYGPNADPGRYVECTVTPIRTARDDLDVVIVELQDQTAQQQAMRDLSLSERRFESLAGLLPHMVWVAGADGAVEYFSPQWAEFTGRPGEQLLGRGYRDLVHPEDVRELDAAGASERTTVVFRLLRHDGVYRWMEAAMQAVTDDAGAVLRWIGGTLDITDRRLAEHAALEQQEQLRAALSVSGLARHTFWVRERRLVGDERLAAIYGIPADALAARDGASLASALVHPDDAQFVQESVRMALSGGADLDVQHRIVRPRPGGESEIRWLATRGRAEFDADGPVRLTGVTEDVTDRRHESEARLRAQKLEALGTLSGAIAHDVNNVISAILSNANAAESELAAGLSPSTSIAEITRGAHRAADIVKRLLTYTRDEEPRRTAFDLGGVVTGVCALLRPTLGHGVALHAVVAPGLPLMRGDSTQLHQVVVNLIRNAVQAIATGPGRIEVTADEVRFDEPDLVALASLPAGEYLRLEVADDGPGIPDDVLPRVFDPFFTTRPSGTGAGLGLAAVQSVIRNHGGVIGVQSRLGAGTTFTAHLPLHPARPSPPSPAPPTPARPSPAAPTAQRSTRAAPPTLARVLFVDDEDALVQLAVRALPYSGFEVTGFTDPHAALAAFTADVDAFDALVTDLSMPGMTGLELTDAIHGLRPELPIILSSGFTTPSAEADAHARGVTSIVSKPCSMMDLADEMRRLLPAR